jgi:AcrR family transcriptional regulator
MAERTPRERMVYSAAQLVRARGMSGVGVRDVIDDAGAPRGSFQYYFPDGKDQLIGEALIWSGTFAADSVRHYLATARTPTPSGLFAHMTGQWKRELSRYDYVRGCPVVATAADVAGSDSPVMDSVVTAAQRWEDAIVETLTSMGVRRRRSRTLALLMLSALEGAIVLARIQRDLRSLNVVVSELRPILDAAVD